jgi:flavin reductase (DIM6/NTAB) family NADH-FMN oxidoreductase RutF
MAIEKSFFRQVMGRFATGITVVTTHSHEGLAGLTVNSFCSVSLDPLLVLVCIDLNSHTLRYFRASKSFVVNILSDRQECLSRCFATPSQERYEHFCRVSYHLAATGSPVIDDALAFVDARIVSEYPGGDHAIFVGRVEAIGVGRQMAFSDEAGEQRSNVTEYRSNGPIDDEVKPLAYYCGQYCHLARDYQRPSLAVYYDEQGYVKVR